MDVKQKTIYYDLTSGKTTFTCTDLKAESEAELNKQIESNVVGIYPSYTFQTMEGFGCAMTETSCYLLSQMDPKTRKSALATWFGPDGMDAAFVRMHIDSCDYSLEEYQAVADPIADPELKTFNIERDLKWNIPVMKEAMEMAGHPISVLLSPWSPPYQWKTAPELAENDPRVYGGKAAGVDFSKAGRCYGGRLKPEYYASWAKYLVMFIQAYLEQGIPVTMLSIQNEAAAATSWDSCLWSGEQECKFLKENLYPELQKAGLTDKLQIFIWDHNKERAVEHIDAFMADPEAAAMIDGFAYHWYSGDHFESLDLLHSRYPEKVLLHSESCGLHVPGKSTAYTFTEEELKDMPEDVKNVFLSNANAKTPNECDFDDACAYAHDIIGDLNHNMQRWIDWNLIVDRTGGPRHVKGGFAAPIVYEEDGSFTKTISYEYLNAIGQAVRPGAVRLGKSVYSTKVEAAAVRNTDGGIGVLLFNPTDADLEVNVRIEGSIVQGIKLPAKTLSTFKITE